MGMGGPQKHREGPAATPSSGHADIGREPICHPERYQGVVLVTACFYLELFCSCVCVLYFKLFASVCMSVYMYECVH